MLSVAELDRSRSKSGPLPVQRRHQSPLELFLRSQHAGVGTKGPAHIGARVGCNDHTANKWWLSQNAPSLDHAMKILMAYGATAAAPLKATMKLKTHELLAFDAFLSKLETQPS